MALSPSLSRWAPHERRGKKRGHFAQPGSPARSPIRHDRSAPRGSAESEPADGRTREVGIAAARQRRPGAVMQQAGSEQEQAAVVEPQLAATPATEAARALVVDGAARVCGVLNESLCDRLRAEIDAQLASAVETGADRANAAGFAPVRTPDRRWDMYQSPATAAVGEALQVLLSGTLGDIFRDLFDGDDDAPLVELSALITDLGAAAQPIHQDTDMDVQTWTAFVALQDIDCTMGPTLMLPGERCHPPTVLYAGPFGLLNVPLNLRLFMLRLLVGTGTHTAAAHRLFEDEDTKDAFLAGRERQLAVLRRGDVAIMDSRLLHAGGANTSPRRRVLFYVTLRHPNCKVYQIGSGSKLAEVDLSLRDFPVSSKSTTNQLFHRIFKSSTCASTVKAFAGYSHR